MNQITSFRLCKLSNIDLIKKVDELTDNLYKEDTGIPVRHIPARPDEDYDLLVGELLLRFKELDTAITSSALPSAQVGDAVGYSKEQMQECWKSAQYNLGGKVHHGYNTFESFLQSLYPSAPVQVEREWISVEDIPLFTKDEKGNWECTENGNGAFLAAVAYNNNTKPNARNLWWVMPCVVEDGTGLCVIGDLENEPAGWRLEDVTYYKILDLTPPSKQQ